MSETEVHAGQIPSAPAEAKGILLDEITEPGAYVRIDTGDLIRVTPGGRPGEPLAWPDAATEPIRVVQLSRDPYLPISQARIAAANLDVEINF